LKDDAVRLAERALRAGTDARLLVGDGMQHDYPLTLPWLDESRHAWTAMCAFVEERCAASSNLMPRDSSQVLDGPSSHQVEALPSGSRILDA